MALNRKIENFHVAAGRSAIFDNNKKESIKMETFPCRFFLSSAR